MKENVKIFASIIDESTKKQVEELSNSAAYHDCWLRAMPDCNAGKGCTTDTVVAIKNKAVPNIFGVDAEKLQMHNTLMKAFAEVDNRPKNCFPEPEDKDTYKLMCAQLAVGYEIGNAGTNIIINEFGEEEHIDLFKQRHPNFEEDIKQAIQ